jgi:hypothetical protein
MSNFSRLYLLVLISFLTALWLAFSAGQRLQAGEAAASPQAVIGVDDFMKNVDRYRGKVSVEGVVSQVVPEQQAFSLIDPKEFQACGATTCAQLTLPVQWRRPLPTIRDLVRVEGQAQEVKGKLRFVADKVEKVSRP